MLDRGRDARRRHARRKVARSRAVAPPSAARARSAAARSSAPDAFPDAIVAEQAFELRRQPIAAARPESRRRASRRSQPAPRPSAAARAYSARIRSHAARSWSPWPSGRVARSVGPASSNRIQAACRLDGQRQDDSPDAQVAERQQQRAFVRMARPLAFSQAMPPSVGMRKRRRPRPDVRLLHGAGDRRPSAASSVSAQPRSRRATPDRARSR